MSESQERFRADFDNSAIGMALARLQEAEERFRLAFDNAPIGMALISPEGRFLRVNHALCEIVGYPADVLLAKTFQDITYPDDLQTDLEYVRQMLTGEIRTYSMEKRYFHADGRVVWINLSVSLVRNDHDAPMYFISQIEDIIRGACRQSDIVGRLSGDEFGVLLVEAHEMDGFEDRVRRRIEEAATAVRYPVSVSIGIARCEPDQECTLAELFERADRAMYDEKLRKP